LLAAPPIADAIEPLLARIAAAGRCEAEFVFCFNIKVFGDPDVSKLLLGPVTELHSLFCHEWRRLNKRSLAGFGHAHSVQSWRECYAALRTDAIGVLTERFHVGVTVPNAEKKSVMFWQSESWLLGKSDCMT
jgi:hypothetical protein